MKYKDEEMKNHVCVVLKATVKEIYGWNTDKDNILADNVKTLLNHVLCSNQHISNTLTDIMIKEMGKNKFYNKWGAIFPAFLDNYDRQIISDNLDRINEEIENIKPIEKLERIDKDKFYKELYSLDKFTLLDLTIPWSKIVSHFKFKPDYFEKELALSEYGYYIGELINISVRELRKKYNKNQWIMPDWFVLKSRVDRYLSDIEANMKKKLERDVL